MSTSALPQAELTQQLIGHLPPQAVQLSVSDIMQAAEKVLPGVSGYCISKAAQRMAMMTAATELAPHGITVNAVAPGTTETDINRDVLAIPEKRAAMVAPILLGRPGLPQDICGAVAFLASAAAAWMTGTTIQVNGGSLIG